MINKIAASVADALAGTQDGATVLIGGFGTAGIPNELIDGLIEQGARDLTVVNNNVGNGDTGLAALLRGHGIDHLVVAGVSTQACVAMTAASAYAHDLSVVLAGEAVASDDAHAHTEAIRWLADEYRQPVADPADGWPHG